MATFATETVGAIARKVFLKTEPSVPWANVQALLQILQTKDINTRRDSNVEQMTKTMSEVGTSEAWKWPVDMDPQTAASSYARGGSWTFNTDDTLVFGSQLPALYQIPIQVPISDLDVHAQAVDNENGIAYLVNKLRNAKIKMGQDIADHLTNPPAVVGANDIRSVLQVIDDGTTHVSTDTINGISTATHANWASDQTALGGNRLTIKTLARKVRDIRRQRMAKIDIIVCGAGVHQFLVDEAEALNSPMYDVVEVFGKNPETGEPRLHLEVSHDVIKVAGAPVIVDESLDTNEDGTVLGISLEDLVLYSPSKANFTVEGWEKVNLSRGEDLQRAQIKWNGFLACFNRRSHFKYTGAKTS